MHKALYILLFTAVGLVTGCGDNTDTSSAPAGSWGYGLYIVTSLNHATMAAYEGTLDMAGASTKTSAAGKSFYVVRFAPNEAASETSFRILNSDANVVVKDPANQCINTAGFYDFAVFDAASSRMIQLAMGCDSDGGCSFRVRRQHNTLDYTLDAYTH